MANTNKREYGRGTYLLQTFPWGFYYGGRVMCSDGVVRRLHRISETPDTFFSIPAAVKVKGKTVSGYVTTETLTTDDEAVAKLVAYEYGKNYDALPDGAWREEV